jgi:CxxC motif-containing protein (DUF1111 family)
VFESHSRRRPRSKGGRLAAYRAGLARCWFALANGRARSVEEAILWHDGEAANARSRFERLPAARRKALLHWLETL